MKKDIKIAIQNNGRLTGPSLDFLKSMNLELNPSANRKLQINCKNTNVAIVRVRHCDIPFYVQEGVVDFGIVGQNVIMENKNSVEVVKKLGFAKCALVIAVPVNSNIKTIRQLNNRRIATSYPEILNNYLIAENINASIIKIGGSVEVVPGLGLSDAICDITNTGESLRENNLIQIKTIAYSESVLICNKNFKYDITKLIKKI